MNYNSYIHYMTFYFILSIDDFYTLYGSVRLIIVLYISIINSFRIENMICLFSIH